MYISSTGGNFLRRAVCDNVFNNKHVAILYGPETVDGRSTIYG